VMSKVEIGKVPLGGLVRAAGPLVAVDDGQMWMAPIEPAGAVQWEGFEKCEYLPSFCTEPMTLSVTIDHGKELRCRNRLRGTPTLSVRCQVRGKPKLYFVTARIKSVEPEWQEKHQMIGFEVGDTLDFKLYDKENECSTGQLGSHQFLPYGFDDYIPLSIAGVGAKLKIIVRVGSTGEQEQQQLTTDGSAVVKSFTSVASVHDVAAPLRHHMMSSPKYAALDSGSQEMDGGAMEVGTAVAMSQEAADVEAPKPNADTEAAGQEASAESTDDAKPTKRNRFLAKIGLGQYRKSKKDPSEALEVDTPSATSQDAGVEPNADTKDGQDASAEPNTDIKLKKDPLFTALEPIQSKRTRILQKIGIMKALKGDSDKAQKVSPRPEVQGTHAPLKVSARVTMSEPDSD